MEYTTTIINDNNIRNLVKNYIEEHDLPNDLKKKKIGNWDVSRVTNMDSLFKNFPNFNEPLNEWNVSNVKYMNSMFGGCTTFNQPLDKWNVSNVKYMNSMFRECKTFNQPLNEWNVSNVKDMDSMFKECTAFNQPLNKWNVINVENMHSMFEGCTAFNQPLNEWNVINLKDMSVMFLRCTKFKQKLNKWNINKIGKWNQFAVFENSAMSNYGVEMDPFDYYPNGFLEPRQDTLDDFNSYEKKFKNELNFEDLNDDDFKKKVLKDDNNSGNNDYIDFDYIDYIAYIRDEILQIFEESIVDRNNVNIDDISSEINRIMVDFKKNIDTNNKTKITESVLYTLVIYILEVTKNKESEFKKYFINEFISNYNLKNEKKNVIIITMTGIDGVFERLTKCMLEPWRPATQNEKYYKPVGGKSKTNSGGRKHKIYKTLKKHKRRYKKTKKNNKLRK